MQVLITSVPTNDKKIYEEMELNMKETMHFWITNESIKQNVHNNNAITRTSIFYYFPVNHRLFIFFPSVVIIPVG